MDRAGFCVADDATGRMLKDADQQGDDMACDVLQAAKAAKAQAESETLAKAKSMVGCHGAIATNLLQSNFQTQQFVSW